MFGIPDVFVVVVTICLQIAVLLPCLAYSRRIDRQQAAGQS